MKVRVCVSLVSLSYAPRSTPRTLHTGRSCRIGFEVVFRVVGRAVVEEVGIACVNRRGAGCQAQEVGFGGLGAGKHDRCIGLAQRAGFRDIRRTGIAVNDADRPAADQVGFDLHHVRTAIIDMELMAGTASSDRIADQQAVAQGERDGLRAVSVSRIGIAKSSRQPAALCGGHIAVKSGLEDGATCPKPQAAAAIVGGVVVKNAVGHRGLSKHIRPAAEWSRHCR